MNIKSLLLGSAAALLAVSGARAADAVEVVAEPEPMEYVRVCDTYGTGYFYIPGTETCLRVGGYIRYDIGGGDLFDSERRDHLDGGRNDTYSKNARFNFKTWTGTETELGTLSTYTEVRFNYSNYDDSDGFAVTGSNTSLNFAWIQLGGFRVGKDESAFTVFPNYAGGVINDDIIGFGPFDTNLISYTFDAGNGFSAILSLEEGNDGRRFRREDDGDLFVSGGHDYRIDSYVPHVVAGVRYAGGWGGATLVAGYDSKHEEFAVKGRVDVTVNDQLSLFVMAGYGTADDSLAAIAAGEADRNFYKNWAGDWAVWAGGSYKFSDKATLNVQGSYTDGGNFIDDAQWAAVANVDYEVVKDFHIIPEVAYADSGDDGEFGGFLRFQRNF